MTCHSRTGILSLQPFELWQLVLLTRLCKGVTVTAAHCITDAAIVIKTLFAHETTIVVFVVVSDRLDQSRILIRCLVLD